MAKIASQIRLEGDLFGKIKYIASVELRTMNAQMEYFLRNGVDDYEEQTGRIITRTMVKSASGEAEE